MDNDKNKSKIEIGSRIKELRINLGMSQEDLAKAIGYKSANSRSTINKVETGINDVTQSKLLLYAKALNTSVSFLLGIEEGSTATETQMKVWNEKFNSNECLKNEVCLIEAIQKQYGKDAVKILGLFNSLNKNGKQKAVENLEDLTAIEKYTEKKGK